MTKEQYKEEKVAKLTKKLKLLQFHMMKQQINLKVRMFDGEKDSEEFIGMLKDLQELQHSIYSVRANTNNSKFFEWHPHIGMNRTTRRQ
jgi:hypothetical protein